MNHALINKQKYKLSIVNHRNKHKHSVEQNHTVKQLLARDRIQLKLKISQPDDLLEREADEMADRVMGMGDIQPKLLSDRRSSINNRLEVANSTLTQKRENKTGLPGNLKNGLESLSGYAMDDVKVHYNSPQPAKLNAHAFAQGSDIHLSSGAEKYLSHEAWHVVQQKQGRVQPTRQLKGEVSKDDNVELYREADVMRGKALQMKIGVKKNVIKSPNLEKLKDLAHCITGRDLRNTSSFTELLRHLARREGRINHFYRDQNNFVTIGVGILIKNVGSARRLANNPQLQFFWRNRRRANVLPRDIINDWKRVNNGKRANITITSKSMDELLIKGRLGTFLDNLYRVRPYIQKLHPRVHMAIIDARFNPAGIAIYGRQLNKFWKALKNHKFNLALSEFKKVWHNRGGRLKARYAQRHEWRVEQLKKGLDASKACFSKFYK